MTVRSVATAFGLTLAAATAAMAQSDVPAPGLQDGIVAQIDTGAGVVKLEDGRMYREQPGTEFISKGHPTALGSLRPGNYVTISGAAPVIVQAGSASSIQLAHTSDARACTTRRGRGDGYADIRVSLVSPPPPTRSRRDWHATHVVASGMASSRRAGIAVPHSEHTP